jgi:hypothetical protein
VPYPDTEGLLFRSRHIISIYRDRGYQGIFPPLVSLVSNSSRPCEEYLTGEQGGARGKVFASTVVR